MTWKTLNFDVVLVIEAFGFRICFEFRNSDFEFPDKLKINWLKNPVWFRLARVMGGR